MNIERFVDGFGNDVYALALIVSKSGESAAEVFLKAARGCDGLDNNIGIYDIVTLFFPLCLQARSNQYAETLSTFGLSKKQEELISELFDKPQTVRAILHLYYENDLTEKQISAVIDKSLGFVSKQISALPEEFKKRMEKHYKEICLKLIPDTELKENAMREMGNSENRLFKFKADTVPRHKWTKRGKTAAVVISVIAAIIIYFVAPLVRDIFINMADNNAEENPLIVYTETENDRNYSKQQ